MGISVHSAGNSFRGSVKLPGSKSISNRLLIIRALCDTHFDVLNLSEAADTENLQRVLYEKAAIYNTGEGGTTTRFFIAFAALRQYQCVINASGRMAERPVEPLVESLNQLGAQIIYLNDDKKLPIQLKGYRLKGDIVELSSDKSSQFASALSLIAPYLANGLRIKLKSEMVSESYLQMTLKLMREYGIDISFKAREIIIENGNYQSKTMMVEADWSSASYFYVIAAFAPDSELYLQGLRQSSLQGDAVLTELMENFGVSTEFKAGGALLKSDGTLPQKFSYDFIDCPELALSFIVLCAGLGVEGRFSGLKTLEGKESNRVQVIKEELAKMDIELNIIDSNNASIPGNKKAKENLLKIKSLQFRSGNDHRIAMALGTIAALSSSPVEMDHADVVEKSFPTFWNELKEIGFKISKL